MNYLTVARRATVTVRGGACARADRRHRRPGGGRRHDGDREATVTGGPRGDRATALLRDEKRGCAPLAGSSRRGCGKAPRQGDGRTGKSRSRTERDLLPWGPSHHPGVSASGIQKWPSPKARPGGTAERSAVAPSFRTAERDSRYCPVAALAPAMRPKVMMSAMALPPRRLPAWMPPVTSPAA